ncbi:MAG: hypothetical protein H6706_16890 [Myxococcales bacterium]|nr:hypothetical protein [Myxococcales bacterium]
MKRSTFLNLCFFVALGAAGAAMIIKFMNSPPGGGGGRGGMGGDTFILLSPVFFVVAAKRATRFGGAAIVLAVLGVAFSVFGLYGALKGPRQPGQGHAAITASAPAVEA